MSDYKYLHIGRAGDLLNEKDRKLYRFLEILPGLSAWLTLILIVALSFLTPFFMALFIIAFDIYWLLKTVYLSFHLRVAYNRLKINSKINWLERLNSLPTSHFQLPISNWLDIYHIIFLPLYKESYEIVSASIEGLLKTNYLKTKMMIVLCWEERGGDETRQVAEAVGRKYKNEFLEFMSVMHPVRGKTPSLAGSSADHAVQAGRTSNGTSPAVVSDEIPGKGSNTAYAAERVRENLVDRLNLPHDKILVSNFDIDTVVSPEYFGILTYTFLTTPDPLKASYQPIPLYVNNIWEAPSFARVVAFSATFWHTIKQERPESATTFSSHSMSWQALEDVGFWQKNMVSEDSRIFWQCFLRYNGDYRVISLYYPVSMDANVAPTTFGTLKNVYKQQRRWAYGVENVPYFLFGFIKNKLIPLKKKLYYGFIAMEGNHSWSTNAIILFLLGWLPVVVGGPEFNKTVLSFNLPYFTRTIMTLAMLGLISSAVLSIILLPPRPPQFGRFKHLLMIFQWLLFPITTILLGAIPALDAQTRLMFGRYMGFWVTPKTRK
ncbi:MAG: glycosyltransferase family 2 protein [Candidatus Yanofskybacteria bacterium]|nr:glycosyltransferase family 2 protein [Candidatus Yanofskybacteria bacterium]